MEWLNALWHDVIDSTTEGFIGVAGILLFLGVIVGAALFRIREIKKREHH